jgi:Nif-specific regulatory protein
MRKNQELHAILEVSRVLTASFDLRDNLQEAMQILATRLEMQRGCVFLLDAASRALNIVAAHGLSRTEIKRGRYFSGEGIVGQVLESRAPMFIPNIGAEPKFLNKTASRPDKSGISFFCIPILLEDSALGVISVDRIYSEAHGSVDDDLRVLQIVASFIAQFVKLYEHFKRKEDELGQLRQQLTERFNLPNIIGESRVFQRVLKSIKKVAATDTTVLLLGESGTGKELIAQTLHYQSPRAVNPFVAVNLAALPENLIEAELFGVERGAYTGATARRVGRFESAHRGTLFLDEIGELPLASQVKLLRVLQERSFERIGSSHSQSVDVRVVAATNRDLEAEVQRGNFREDLYWRLNVVPIVLPPLRERREDILLLTAHYLKKFNQDYSQSVRMENDALAALMQYHWPGNVRELANTIERFVIMADRDVIRVKDLPANLMPGKTIVAALPAGGNGNGDSLNQEVKELEKKRIIKALQENNLIQNRASLALGITPRQLGYRIKKYQIDLRKIGSA